MDKNTNVLDLLLRGDMPNVQKTLPTARYKVKRLSQEAGSDVVFTLRALTYGRAEEIRQSVTGDVNLQIVLAGVADPDLKDPSLRDKYGGPTPAEMLKGLLLPGEIEDLARAIERLTGYRRETISEVKNG